jgi:hypothetical protein
MNPHSEIHVVEPSTEEAFDGVIEFWQDNRMLAMTRLYDGRTVIRFEQPPGDESLEIGVAPLLTALETARQRLNEV